MLLYEYQTNPAIIKRFASINQQKIKFSLKSDPISNPISPLPNSNPTAFENNQLHLDKPLTLAHQNTSKVIPTRSIIQSIRSR